jgi:hypothetical protein
MRPAFSSSRQAAAFALLLLALLLAPALARKRFLPPRKEIYSSIWWASGDYPFFYHEIFQAKEPIDILFIGASHIHTAFDTPYVQEQLSNKLARPAVARTFGWGWPGYDNLYFVTRDLLATRQVRMLVFDDLYNLSDRPHILAPHMFRFGDDADVLDGLPFRAKMSYYFAAVVGMPHNLLGLIRTNFAPNLHPDKPTHFEIHDRALNPVTQLGALTGLIGYSPNFLADYYEHGPFVEYTPQRVSSLPMFVFIRPTQRQTSRSPALLFRPYNFISLKNSQPWRGNMAASSFSSISPSMMKDVPPLSPNLHSGPMCWGQMSR